MVVNPDERAIAVIRRRLLRWGREQASAFPWREPPNPFLGLIAEVMLQRTRASSVVPVYLRFVERYPTARHLAEAEESEIGDLMKSLGLNWRVPLLRALGARLAEMEQIPDSLEELVALPGIGPYTAAAFLTFHGNRRGVLIDSNIVRWLARLTGRDFGSETRRKRWVRELAEKLTPQHRSRAYNYAVLDFTMMVCTVGRPRCEVCPLGPSLCVYGRSASAG